MPRTFLIWSKTRWRSALSFGSRSTKAPSLVRSSITSFTAALTSSSVKFLVLPVAGALALPETKSCAFLMLASAFLRKVSFDLSDEKQSTLPSGAAQFTEQSVLIVWPSVRPMAQELSNSPLTGAGVAGEAGVAAGVGLVGLAASSAAAGPAAAKPSSSTAAMADRMGALIMAFLLGAFELRPRRVPWVPASWRISALGMEPKPGVVQSRSCDQVASQKPECGWPRRH